MPVLVLWGEEDRVIPVAYAGEYARLVPDAQVVRFPLCGHSPAREKPAERFRGLVASQSSCASSSTAA